MRSVACVALYIFVLALLPSVAALGRVYVRQDCLALGYQLSVQQQRRDALRAEVRKAELERARGRAPAALAQMAQRLHLGPPRPDQNVGAQAPTAKAAKARAQPH